MEIEGWNLPPTRGIEDRQQAEPICFCTQCGREIYPGNEFYTDTPDSPACPGSVTIHKDCLMEWVGDLGDAAVASAFGFKDPGAATKIT